MKACFKCQKMLPMSEFYKHPQMGDGHLGKCKTCTRKDTADRVALKSSTDLDWVMKERERHRIKSELKRRRMGVGKRKPAKDRIEAQRLRRSLYPDKYLANMMVGNAVRDGRLKKLPCEKCGRTPAQAHHDDYSKPLSVRWLCIKHHSEFHINQRDALIKSRF